MDPKFRIKAILADRGITQRDLAETTGMSAQSLSGALREGANPTLSTLERIARALDVTVAELFSDYKYAKPTVINCPYARYGSGDYKCSL